MQLTAFRVRRFRNILDSTEIPVHPNITCLVGKNESGKTAILRALYMAKPAYGEQFDAQAHYPRWRLSADRKRDEVDGAAPIEVTLALQPDDVASVEQLVGEGVLTGESFRYGRRYDGSWYAEVDVDEGRAVRNLLARLQLDQRTADALAEVTSVESLRDAIAARRADLETADDIGDDDPPGAAEAPLRADLDAIEEEIARTLGQATSIRGRLLGRLRPGCRPSSTSASTRTSPAGSTFASSPPRT